MKRACVPRLAGRLVAKEIDADAAVAPQSLMYMSDAEIFTLADQELRNVATPGSLNSLGRREVVALLVASRQNVGAQSNTEAEATVVTKKVVAVASHSGAKTLGSPGCSESSQKVGIVVPTGAVGAGMEEWPEEYTRFSSLGQAKKSGRRKKTWGWRKSTDLAPKKHRGECRKMTSVGDTPCKRSAIAPPFPAFDQKLQRSSDLTGTSGLQQISLAEDLLCDDKHNLFERVRPLPLSTEDVRDTLAKTKLNALATGVRRRFHRKVTPKLSVNVGDLEKDPALCEDHAAIDANGDLVKAQYSRFIVPFREAELASGPHDGGTHPGMKPGEDLPPCLRPWQDTDRKKNGSGWIVCMVGGARTRWFNRKTYGSWRLAFLLARLQHAVWTKQKCRSRAQVSTQSPNHACTSHKVGEDLPAKKTRRIIVIGSDSGKSHNLDATIKCTSGESPSVPKLPSNLGAPCSSSGDCVGPLYHLISNSAFAQNILADIERDGFTVIPRVLYPPETEAALSRMWDFVETVSPTVRRAEAETWYARGRFDPWPHFGRDMIQGYHAGWLFGDVREALAQRVFERLYGVRELHSSKDGFCFQRPTRAPLSRRPIDHFDQLGSEKGLYCIQGSVALLDQEPDDGCFCCWPKSHRHHVQLAAASAKRDWYQLTHEDIQVLSAAGCVPQRVPVRRGDVILWRSDLVHCGACPVGVRESFRAVIYVCMLPAKLTPQSMYSRKQEAYKRLATGSHWPTKETWFRSKPLWNRGLDARPFYSSLPMLNERQQELYGLRKYGSLQH